MYYIHNILNVTDRVTLVGWLGFDLQQEKGRLCSAPNSGKVWTPIGFLFRDIDGNFIVSKALVVWTWRIISCLVGLSSQVRARGHCLWIWCWEEWQKWRGG